MKFATVKKAIITLLHLTPLISITFSYSATAPDEYPDVLVFTSKGGYGHMSASEMIQKMLPHHKIKIINPFESVLRSIDFVHTASFGKMDCEDFYNKLMKNGWNHTLNFFVRYPGKMAIRLRSKTIEKKIYNLLCSEKPKLVLSLIPMINYPISQATARRNIPFLLMTLDMDLETYLFGMEKCTHQDFHMTVVQKTPRISRQLKEHAIIPSQVTELGFHLRQSFFEKKNVNKILHEWKLPHNKPKIMIMMGSVGANNLVAYVKKLLTLPIPAHLMVCVGRNNTLATQINRLPHNKNVSVSVIPFTTQVADLMAVADLFITKPGPNSCYEALHMGLPTLVDATGSSIFWEKASLDLIHDAQHCSVIRHINDLPSLVKKHLGSKQYHDTTKNSFEKKLKNLIAKMIHKHETYTNKQRAQ